MARKEDMSNTKVGDRKLGVFTLNETIVGEFGDNNKRSDVQLVQFFLRQFYKKHPELFAMLPKTKSGATEFKIDGKCGGQTEFGIFLFQKNRSEKGGIIKVDGLVNVAHSLMSSISATAYTIHHLNIFFMESADGKEHHGNLENHPDIRAFAPELQSELFKAKVGDEF